MMKGLRQEDRYFLTWEERLGHFHYIGWNTFNEPDEEYPLSEPWVTAMVPMMEPNPTGIFVDLPKNWCGTC